MYNFSEEELLELAEYPKQAIEHANKQMTSMLHQGKSIAHPFKWLLAVCDRWVEEQNKTTKTGKTKLIPSKPRPSTFSAYVEGGKWIPGAAVINNDRNYQTTITHVETDLEFALNYEKAIHKRTLENPEFAKKCARFDKNPIWQKLTPEQQESIWQQAHGPECSCRRNEQAGLIMPDIAKKLAEKIIPTDMSELEQEYYDPSLFQEIF